MQCKKCHAENADTTIFCHQCGSKLSKEISKRKIKLAILGGLIGVVLISGTIYWTVSNNPVKLFKTAIENNNYKEAIEIYNKKIDGTEQRESKIRIFLVSDIQKIKQEFIDEKINYRDATSKLYIIGKINFMKLDVKKAEDEIVQINRSKNAFTSGEELLKEKKLKEALLKFNDVNNLDPTNYTKAQEIIKQSSTEYKTIILDETEKLASAKNYDEAAKLMGEALTIISKDNDFKAKKKLYEQKHEEKQSAELKEKIATLKKEQKVIVIETSTFDDSDDTYLSITIKNNSNKVIKNYTVSWIGLDKYGRPLKTGWVIASYLRTASEDYIIQPGKTAGSSFGWQVTGSSSESEDAVSYIACVKEVKYDDGSSWNNWYYDYWVDEFIDEADQ